MKIGIISDVHSNLPALKVVLDKLDHIDHIIHAGDIVGYNPFPKQVISLFRKNNIYSIKGNHDRVVLGELNFPPSSIAGRAAKWTKLVLSSEEISYLESLPIEQTLFDNLIRIAHGAPGSPNRYVYPKDYSDLLLKDEQVLVLGHTHIQSSKRFNNGVIVNPGSVGQPRDGDSRAAYAILNTETLKIELNRIKYPIYKVQEKIKEVGLPEEIGKRLNKGK